MTIKELLDKILQSPITKAIGGCFMEDDELELIKKDLERLEKINNVWHKNETMESVDINAMHLQEVYDFQHRLYEENEKFKKAIDIIKSKRINIHLFISLLSRKYPYKGISGFLFNCLRDEYNHITLKHFGTSLDNLLTEEECEILKEVLEND